MSNIDVAADDNQALGPPPPPGGGDAPGGANPTAGGGPVLAALTAQRQGPQMSAPGPGNQADAMMKVKAGMEMIQSALPGLGVGTPVHTAALRALQQLSRHMASGSPTAGVQSTMLQDLLRRTMQSGLMQKVAGQRASGGKEGGQPPMPSPPMPGS